MVDKTALAPAVSPSALSPKQAHIVLHQGFRGINYLEIVWDCFCIAVKVPL